MSESGAYLKPADPGDTDQLSLLIAQAFHPLAPSRWLIPDEESRRAILPRYFRILVQDAMHQGMVYTTTALDAVALWFPTGETVPEDVDDYDQRLAAATGPWAERFRTFDAALGSYHPPSPRHHHLAILAVRPDRQHRNIGSDLLREHHAILDRTGTPAYLEASDTGTRSFYQRQGYTDCADPIRLPDGGPAMHPMWRHPATPSNPQPQR